MKCFILVVHCVVSVRTRMHSLHTYVVVIFCVKIFTSVCFKVCFFIVVSHVDVLCHLYVYISRRMKEKRGDRTLLLLMCTVHICIHITHNRSPIRKNIDFLAKER